MPPRTRPRRAVLAAPLCAGVLALGALPASAAPDTGTISLVAPATAAVGDTITVTLELGDAVDVYAYALTVEADPDVLAVVPDSGTGPEGGFDSTELLEPGATLVHSRLGSSPALDGDLTAALQLDVVGPGTADVAVSVELVGADGTSTTLPAATSAEIVVAAPEPTPTDPTEPPTAEPSPSEPAPTASPTDEDDDAVPAPAAPPTSGGGSLPSTGLDAWPLGAAAAVLAAAGALVLASRRRAGGAL